MLIQMIDAQLPPFHIFASNNFALLIYKCNMKDYSLFVCINFCHIYRQTSIKIKPGIKEEYFEIWLWDKL